MLKAGKYPYQLKRRILSDSGHLSNESAAELVHHLARQGTKRFILGHLSAENNYPRLAYEAVNSLLKIKGYDTEREVFLAVAERDRPGEPIIL
jgi:phosphoribosyl 1,2-cyclic phosphodiesterase